VVWAGIAAHRRLPVWIALFAGALALAAASAGHANWLVTKTPFHDQEPGSVGIGYAARFGQSPYEGVGDIGSVYSDYNYDLVPLYLYEGEYLFSHGTEWGVHVWQPENFRVDLLARYRFDRLQEESSEFLEGMTDRKQTVDIGAAMMLQGGWGQLHFSAVTDLMDRHEGEELDLTYLFPWERGRWTLIPSIGVVYKSASLTNYYYGVRPEEALPDRPGYTPGSAYNWRVGLNAEYHWLENWHLFANVAYEGLDDVIKNSPIVARDGLLSAYLGITWSLGNMKHIETRKPDTKLWSWRVNAGYTVDDTFSQVLLGNFKPHKEIDTYMMGFTLGRLLKDGRRGDVWARFSINRRFENDFQDDFNEYVAYVMAIGSGYAPWTDREVFRFGFGLGISYAEKIPAVEIYKQARRGEQTSHWLNYMEAMVDFPFRTLFGKNATEDCYIGATLVHRSGIFGRADLFNSTQGGSEVLTGHVECKF
jgi:outer membrane scaffolding protein for murein synthesis (MipA/OmpV family)